MPFCTNCGNEVGVVDKFCARCGAPQTGAPGPGPAAGVSSGSTTDPLRSVSSRTASLICYVPLVGWIAAIVVLASPRFLRDYKVRFHAFQGLYLFVAWLLIEMVVSPVMHMSDADLPHLISRIMHLTIYFAQIFMLVKVSQNETYSLPVVGELAQRSVAEQR